MPQDILAKLWTIGLMDTRAVPDMHCGVSPLPCSLFHPCHATSHPQLQDHTSLQGLCQVMEKVVHADGGDNAEQGLCGYSGASDAGQHKENLVVTAGQISMILSSLFYFALCCHKSSSTCVSAQSDECQLAMRKRLAYTTNDCPPDSP